MALKHAQFLDVIDLHALVEEKKPRPAIAIAYLRVSVFNFCKSSCLLIKAYEDITYRASPLFSV